MPRARNLQRAQSYFHRRGLVMEEVSSWLLVMKILVLFLFSVSSYVHLSFCLVSMQRGGSVRRQHHILDSLAFRTIFEKLKKINDPLLGILLQQHKWTHLRIWQGEDSYGKNKEWNLNRKIRRFYFLKAGSVNVYKSRQESNRGEGIFQNEIWIRISQVF